MQKRNHVDNLFNQQILLEKDLETKQEERIEKGSKILIFIEFIELIIGLIFSFFQLIFYLILFIIFIGILYVIF